MQRIKAQHGAKAVAFSMASGSTTAIGDSAPFVRRLMNAFGTPNLYNSFDVCGWGRGFATQIHVRRRQRRDRRRRGRDGRTSPTADA